MHTLMRTDNKTQTELNLSSGDNEKHIPEHNDDIKCITMTTKAGTVKNTCPCGVTSAKMLKASLSSLTLYVFYLM